METPRTAHSILIVDDGDRLRKSLKRSLDQENYETWTAASGEEALEIFEKTRIDLLITDLVMPGMGGMALIRSIQSAVPSMKVIIITAYGSAESMQETEQLGVHHYLTKPFDLVVLKRTVNALLGPEASAASSRTSPCWVWYCGVHGLCLAVKMLGAFFWLSQKVLRRTRPTSMIHGFGKTTKTLSRIASVLMRR